MVWNQTTVEISRARKAFNLYTSNRSFILTEFVKLLFHVAEDYGARRGADCHRLSSCTKNVLVLPLLKDTGCICLIDVNKMHCVTQLETQVLT